MMTLLQRALQQDGCAVTEPVCSCNRLVVIKCKIHPGHEVLIQPGGSSQTFTAFSLWKHLLILQTDTFCCLFSPRAKICKENRVVVSLSSAASWISVTWGITWSQ